jgi:hypothetical protein
MKVNVRKLVKLLMMVLSVFFPDNGKGSDKPERDSDAKD